MPKNTSRSETDRKHTSKKPKTASKTSPQKRARANHRSTPRSIELKPLPESVSEQATVDSAGRIVLPARFRKALGLASGASVVVTLDDSGLRVQTRQRAIERAQTLMRDKNPQRRSLVDDLIAERRAEAATE